MLGLAVLPLIAMGILFTVFDSDAEDDDYEGEVPETPEEPEEPETPEAEVVNGTDGSDVIDASGNQILNGLDGDDALSSSDASNGAVVNGGNGNDIINLAGINATGTGGEGDDLISASYATGGSIDGGAGDDILNVWRNSNGVVLDGGSGNDTITDEAFLETPAAGAVPDMLTGGTDADSFFINLVNPIIYEGGAQITEGDLGILSQITDFNIGEDMLVIDVNNADSPDSIDPVRTLDSFTLVEADDGSYTDIQLFINSVGSTGQLTATIRLEGVTGLTADDIVFADRDVA